VISTIAHLRRHAAGQPIWVCGKSIGTAGALLAASEGGISGVILRNAMPLRELFSRRYAWRSLGLSRIAVAPLIPARLDSLANARRATAPAFFLVSRADRVVPPPYQRRVIEAYRGRTTVLEVAGGHDERVLAPPDEAEYGRLLRSLVQ
jgi:pimeloyl-ACP methyl ester carboxylesterase